MDITSSETIYSIVVMRMECCGSVDTEHTFVSIISCTNISTVHGIKGIVFNGICSMILH